MTRDGSGWDHASSDEFFEYYAAESLKESTLRRFRRQRDTILGLVGPRGLAGKLDIADIGSGPGTLAMIWAEAGHRVVGLDINEPLVRLARKRADAAGLDIRFELGSATSIPLADASIDLCIAPELLEHVADWRACLDEFARILRPQGALFLSTTNRLCPRQQEYNLPFYSWYPGYVKRKVERAAMTTRPALANHATYPAVHWFSYRDLRTALFERGFATFWDKFDLAAAANRSGLKSLVLVVLRASAASRWLGHVATEGTAILAAKE